MSIPNATAMLQGPQRGLLLLIPVKEEASHRYLSPWYSSQSAEARHWGHCHLMWGLCLLLLPKIPEEDFSIVSTTTLLTPCFVTSRKDFYWGPTTQIWTHGNILSDTQCTELRISLLPSQTFASQVSLPLRHSIFWDTLNKLQLSLPHAQTRLIFRRWAPKWVCCVFTAGTHSDWSVGNILPPGLLKS